MSRSVHAGRDGQRRHHLPRDDAASRGNNCASGGWTGTSSGDDRRSGGKQALARLQGRRRWRETTAAVELATAAIVVGDQSA